MSKEKIEDNLKHARSSGSKDVTESQDGKATAVVEIAVSKDEAILAGFGKKQQLKVSEPRYGPSRRL